MSPVKESKFRMIMVPFALFLLTLSAAVLLVCRQAGGGGDDALLTVERIYASRDFAAQRFGPARWLENGSGYTTLEEGRSGGRDIVRYDPASGAREVLVADGRLIPPGEAKPLQIADYIWSEDGSKLLVFTNTRRVWRRNTRGDYWVLDLSSRDLKKLGPSFEESSLMFAKFSPDASRVAYVAGNNIYVENLGTGAVTPLTKDGSETLINGTSDWVYEEEFGVRDGFRWSPDGRFIAFWQMDSSAVGRFSMINNTDTLYPRITTFRHPKVGTSNSSVKVGVVGAEGGDILWFDDLPGDPREHYIARLDWAPGSGEICFQRLNRLQNTDRLLTGNIETGEIRTLLTEKDEAWVEVVDDLHWLEEGQRFTWMSERDGWNHAFAVSRSGREMTLLTPGEYDVVSVDALDEDQGWLYFTASPEDPTSRYLYRVPLDGTGMLERITPEDLKGSHRYQISRDARWAIHTASAFGSPPAIDLVELPGHGRVRSLVDNSRLHAAVDKLSRGEAEFDKIDIGGGVALDCWRMLPPDFDPSKKYPLFFYIYGEPAGSTVQNSWGGSTYLWHLMLTQKGYVVMSVDPRGTRMPKGREWRKCIYRKVGITAPRDHAAAVRKILSRSPFIDKERVGIWGWSGGGQMSLNAIFRFPELYKTAMAVAFVSDQLLYDTIYQERYMGLPDDNAEGYRDGSPITHAKNLEGNLLIIHGTGDDNVHYQSFERLVNELVRHNKRFSMMSYPNRSHGIYEGENTTLHLRTLLTDYLLEHMPPHE
jgi:dipeptidyl-peptidase-4